LKELKQDVAFHTKIETLAMKTLSFMVIIRHKKKLF